MAFVNDEFKWKCSGCGRFHKIRLVLERCEVFEEDER